MPAPRECDRKDTAAERIGQLLSRALAVFASVVCLFLSLSLLASVGGYALQGWIGALTGLGLAWATVGIGLAVVARSTTAKNPEPSPQIAVPVPPVAYGQPVVPVSPHVRAEPELCEDDDAPSLSSRVTLPLAALALGAAAFIGPVRALRMGLRLYSLWAGISRMLADSQSSTQGRR